MQPRELSKEEVAFLVKVARHVGIRPQDLKPEQPWVFTGKRAEMLQEGARELDPVRAAQWQSEAGGKINLLTAACEMGLEEHTAETKADLLQHSPEAVLQEQQRQADWEKQWREKEEEKWRVAYEARTGQSADDYGKKFYPANWQGEAMRRQDELNAALGANQ